MRIGFTKMHGAGNDFVVFDEPLAGAHLGRDRLRSLADRRSGIGFDQALLIGAPRAAGAAASYRVFNADGDEVEQCGNGARCIAALLHARGRAAGAALTLESPVGPVQTRIGPDGRIAVDLGVPDFAPAALPFVAAAEADRYELEVDGQRLEIGAVSLGNPHAVLLVPDVDRADVARLGPAIEHHPRFPRRVNVGFLQVLGSDRVRLRVHERGAGETPACGTGACAAVAVGRRWGLLGTEVQVGVRGGELQVNWAAMGAHIWLAGPADISYTGHLEV